MSNEHLEKLREGILIELLKANQHFKIFWELYSAPKRLANVIDEYIDYFFYTTLAHHDCFCISIYNVTKHDSQTSNIPRLINHITSNKTFQRFYSIDEIKDLQEILDSHKDLIKRLQFARVKYIAHNEILKNPADIHINHKQAEGEKLLNDLTYIFNTLSTRYDITEYALDVESNLTAAKMLSDLNEYHQIKKAAPASD